MVGPHPPPGEAAVGGVEAVMATLVRSLRDLDVEITVVTCVSGARAPRRVRDAGVDYVMIPTDRTRGRLTWYAAERGAIRRALREERPDIAHAQGANFYGPATIASGLPSVVTLHGIHRREARITDTSSGVIERCSKRLRGAGNAHFERVTLRRATDIVIISPYVEEALGAGTSARLHRVANPIAADFFAVERRPVPAQVLFVGSIEPRKNVLTLVNAFHATRDTLPAARLHIAGPPKDPAYHSAVMAAVAAAADDRIAYLGVVSDEELLEEYATASVLVLPSREESSPLAIQQAMAAGVAVVASRAGGIERLVRHDVTGLLVTPGDERELAEAVTSLLRSDRCAAMGEAARSSAESFAPRAVAEATLALYEEVLARRRR